jgi:hypothetical protein
MILASFCSPSTHGFPMVVTEDSWPAASRIARFPVGTREVSSTGDGKVQFDMGLWGLTLLAGMALGFGVLAQLVGRSATRWIGLIAGVGFFAGGILFSEVVFAGEDVQPIIDGLSFDEALLGGIVVGVPVTILTWLATRARHHHGPMAA